MIAGLIFLGVAVVGICVVICTRIYEGRKGKDIADTADWPETEATIHDAGVERLDKYTWYPSFTFSYSVQGEYLSGRLFLKADQRQSEELITSLLNQKFRLQYNPDNPAAWYVADPTIAGCEIVQPLSMEYSSAGLYTSESTPPIDLHLNN